MGAMRVVLASAARTSSDSQLRRTVERAVEQLADEIAALRGLISELRPAALDELGLAAAIEGLVEQQATSGELEIDAEVDLLVGHTTDPMRLEPELESTLYRVIQEALTNVVKHSGAERVRLVLREAEERIEILVRDDGCGFEPDGATNGLGLVGMRERIELADGELDVRSRPGAGTTLRAWVPARWPQDSISLRSSA